MRISRGLKASREVRTYMRLRMSSLLIVRVDLRPLPTLSCLCLFGIDYTLRWALVCCVTLVFACTNLAFLWWAWGT